MGVLNHEHMGGWSLYQHDAWNWDSDHKKGAAWRRRCAIEEMATQEVFAQLPLEEDDDPMIGIQFLELRGDKCFDLLANTKGGEKKKAWC